MQEQNSGPPPDTEGLSPIALGYYWAANITSMGFELALPIAVGIWIDIKLGTKCVFLIFGVFLGLSAMTINFVKLMRNNKLRQMSSKDQMENSDKTK